MRAMNTQFCHTGARYQSAFGTFWQSTANFVVVTPMRAQNVEPLPWNGYYGK
jgi:hypothetical protein